MLLLPAVVTFLGSVLCLYVLLTTSPPWQAWAILGAAAWLAAGLFLMLRGLQRG